MISESVSRPALHHSDSIQVKSVVQSPEDSGKSGSEGSAESERKRRGSSGSPVYLVTSPCGSPQEVTVPMVPQMSPFCMDEDEDITAGLFKQTMDKEHHH